MRGIGQWVDGHRNILQSPAVDWLLMNKKLIMFSLCLKAIIGNVI